MKETIFELRAYSTSLKPPYYENRLPKMDVFLIRIYTELKEAQEVKDKLISGATELNQKIMVIILPFKRAMNEKGFKPFLRGMKDYDNFNQLNK